MQTQEKLEIEQDLWEEAAEIFVGATHARIVAPEPGCECLACHVARLYLLPFLPVTWH